MQFDSLCHFLNRAAQTLAQQFKTLFIWVGESILVADFAAWMKILFCYLRVGHGRRKTEMLMLTYNLLLVAVI